MKQKFEVILLGEVWDLLDNLDEKVKDKILYNVDKSKFVNDPKLFKKLRFFMTSLKKNRFAGYRQHSNLNNMLVKVAP